MNRPDFYPQTTNRTITFYHKPLLNTVHARISQTVPTVVKPKCANTVVHHSEGWVSGSAVVRGSRGQQPNLVRSLRIVFESRPGTAFAAKLALPPFGYRSTFPLPSQPFSRPGSCGATELAFAKCPTQWMYSTQIIGVPTIQAHNYHHQSH